MVLQAGDKFPEGVKFGYISWAPILDEDPTVCGIPQMYDANKEWAGKKVVIVSVPGAFTPSCSAYHLPPYVQKFEELKSKGVDKVAFISNNDEYVLAGWGKVNKVPKGEDFLMLSDTKTFFSKNYGWQAGPNKGDRTGRWAMIVEKDGTISYAENEGHLQEVKASAVETILTKV
ncbi:AhpC/TSA family protein-like protein [Aureobasidium pullulans]|uniref:AhpC/TSA family protein-like protein n=1 Tax=Aureobasidium pullulans TaxID=5580 RepID=A0AB38LPP1_AURPU|nr:AhpC/TSA family protein-like protein [Aureobasidium pullulans]THZ42766.1 AhpC/TSA family protein-like protein [Aureobasidium pullulans]